jgi:hypothetical protein
MGRSRRKRERAKQRARAKENLGQHRQTKHTQQVQSQPTVIQVSTPRFFRRIVSGIARTFFRVWKIVVVFGCLLGMANVFLAWNSRLSVTSLSSLNPLNPFATPFMVTNDGYFPVYTARFACMIEKIEYEPLSPDDTTTIQHNRLRLPAQSIGRIGAREARTIQCQLGIGRPSPITAIDLVIQVCFRPLLLPWDFHQQQRFVTAKDSSGQIHWIKQPIEGEPSFQPCPQS